MHDLDKLNSRHKNRVINNFRVIEISLINEQVEYGESGLTVSSKERLSVYMEEMSTSSPKILTLDEFSLILKAIGESL